MKKYITTFLITVSIAVTARVEAEGIVYQVPIERFLDGLRTQFINMNKRASKTGMPMMVESLHVEMNVVVGSELAGEGELFVLKGTVKKSDIVTQVVSFDLKLPKDYYVNREDMEKAYHLGYLAAKDSPELVERAGAVFPPTNSMVSKKSEEEKYYEKVRCRDLDICVDDWDW